MSAYVIIESKVKNPEKYQQYILLVPEIVAKHGGRYLVRGGRFSTIKSKSKGTWGIKFLTLSSGPPFYGVRP